MGWGWGVDTMGEEKMKRRCNELGGGGSIQWRRRR